MILRGHGQGQDLFARLPIHVELTDADETDCHLERVHPACFPPAHRTDRFQDFVT